MDRRTKIVCTLGPATGTKEKVYQLVEVGMDFARLNFSHGSYEMHKQNYQWVRAASDSIGRAVGVLADLQGPKIRLGTFINGLETWSTGEKVCITTDDVPGTHDRVSTTYKHLANDAKVGNRLLIDDGKISLVVVGVSGNNVLAEVIEGGTVSNHKGISLPGMDITVPALSEKDVKDLHFALKLGVDMIALSFVRSPDDINRVHAEMDKVGRRVPVMAKLEKPEAVERLPEIVAAFDAIMVARGDLGVEVPLEEVPTVQKRAIHLARASAKPVVVATQMLESMIENSRPTRAEASDVANAVYDGTDAIMLSGETSVGKFPFSAVDTMDKISRAVESENSAIAALSHQPKTRSGVVSYAAKDIAEKINAKALVAFTLSGDTVRRLARLHSRIPILAFTPTQEVRSQLALSWGTETFIIPRVRSTEEMVAEVDRALLSIGRYKQGDTITIVAGSPVNLPGATNMIHIHRIGEDD